jgi:histidine triad (HIT) family protein
MSNGDCIFCKIVAGDIPSERVYEDSDVIAFLDINPIAPGHTLVVPKTHCTDLLDATPETLDAVMRAAQNVAPAVLAATDGEGFNFFQFNGRCAGQEVFHLHFHIIPRRSDDDVSYRWTQGSYGDGEMAALGERVRDALEA